MVGQNTREYPYALARRKRQLKGRLVTTAFLTRELDEPCLRSQAQSLTRRLVEGLGNADRLRRDGDHLLFELALQALSKLDHVGADLRAVVDVRPELHQLVFDQDSFVHPDAADACGLQRCAAVPRRASSI